MPGERVLEIGPGLGFLTGGLLAAGAAVTAVELDRGMAAFLRDTFAAEVEEARLRLIEGDALDQDLVGLVAPPYDVVANLPYHITSPVLHRLLGRAPRADRLVLMLQREVAERVAAAPGRDVVPVGVRPVPRRRPGSRSACRARRSSRRPRSSRPSSCSSRTRPTTGWTRRRRTTCGASSRPASASAARCSTTCSPGSCPIEPDRVDAALDGRRHRPRPAPADRRGGGVDRARRGARPDPGGPMTPGVRGDLARGRRRPPPRAGDPARAGEGQPHARGPGHAGPTGSTTCTA